MSLLRPALPDVRLLVDRAARSGVDNMFLDELILNTAVSAGINSIRLYAWNAPTVSLGHFQRSVDPLSAARFQGLPQVRRLSGGGAILHHHELTYSCAITRDHPLARQPTELYGAMHTAIIATLQEFSITATMRGTTQEGPEPFLCFGRCDPRDIVIGKDKVVGSAQRRRSGAVLQHGSILLTQSPYAEGFPGIQDLTGQDLSTPEFRDRLATRLLNRLGQLRPDLSWDQSEWTCLQQHHMDAQLDAPAGIGS